MKMSPALWQRYVCATCDRTRILGIYEGEHQSSIPCQLEQADKSKCIGTAYRKE